MSSHSDPVFENFKNEMNISGIFFLYEKKYFSWDYIIFSIMKPGF